MKKQDEKQQEVHIVEVRQGRVDVCILGTTPLIQNRLSEKAKRELLMPKGAKSKAEKASTLKHDPIEEYRASCFKTRDPRSTTRLVHPAGAFHKAISSVAIDLPGVEKAKVGRLTTVTPNDINIYGVPQIMTAIVRLSDMARTPDPRTRLVIPEWACYLSVTYIQPIMREVSVLNLLAAAGIMRGVGDWRVEKGSGSFGQFKLVSQKDADFQRIVKTGGMKAQDAALEHPECFDYETEELLEWFDDAVVARGFKTKAA